MYKKILELVQGYKKYYEEHLYYYNEYQFVFISLIFILLLLFIIDKIRITFFRKKIISQRNQIEKNIEKIKELEVRIEGLVKFNENMIDQFKFISSEIANQQTHNFLRLTSNMMEKIRSDQINYNKNNEEKINVQISPLYSVVDQLNNHISKIEKENILDRQVLLQHIREVVQAEKSIHDEINKFIHNMRSSNVKGAWGEQGLLNLLKAAGMTNYFDFEEQKSYGNIKPDLIVKLPGGGIVVIDSKVPLASYLKAMDTSDEKQKKNFFSEHVRQIKYHVTSLQQKKYWEHIEDSVDFVVMFLPGESFLSAALDYCPSLIDFAISRGVLIASPTTLLGLLKTISYGWKNFHINRDIVDIKSKIISLQNFMDPIVDKLNNFEKSLEKSKKDFSSLNNLINENIVLEINNFASKYSNKQEKNEIDSLSDFKDNTEL